MKRTRALKRASLMNIGTLARHSGDLGPTANTSNHHNFTGSEVATILHGLRMIQAEGRIEGCNAADCEHFDEAEQLTNAEIDDLCERINLDPCGFYSPSLGRTDPEVYNVDDLRRKLTQGQN